MVKSRLIGEVIIFMGDNGYFLGERQLTGKWLMYDNSLRVPLMILDPRANKHVDVAEMAMNIDVPATILDAAGVKLEQNIGDVWDSEHQRSGKTEVQYEGTPLSKNKNCYWKVRIWDEVNRLRMYSDARKVEI